MISTQEGQIGSLVELGGAEPMGAQCSSSTQFLALDVIVL